MNEQLPNLLSLFADTEAEWKIGSQLLSLSDKQRILDLLTPAVKDQSPYASLLESPDAYRGSGLDLSFPLRIWSIQSAKDLPEILDFIASVFPEDISFLYGNDELLLFQSNPGESDCKPLDIYCDLEAQGYKGLSIYTSSLILRTENLYHSYVVVGQMREVSRILRAKAHVFEADQMLLPTLLYRLKQEQPNALLPFHENSAMELDQDLMDTAIEFLSSNLNVTETANRLYIHRNTLLYRLGKIHTLTGYDIRNFMEAANFYLIYLSKIFGTY